MSENKTTNRLDYLDFLKGLAILMIVLTHTVDALNIGSKLFYNIFFQSLFSISLLAAPFFLTVTGFVSYVFYKKYLGRNVSLISIKRGLFVFLIGIFVNFLFQGNLLNWDILQIIGLYMILMPIIHYLSPWIILVLVSIIVILAPFLREMLSYSSFWEGGLYLASYDLMPILYSAISNGYFPIFPWFSYPLLGILIYKWYDKLNIKHSGISLVISIMLFLYIKMFLLINSYYNAPTLFLLTTYLVIILAFNFFKNSNIIINQSYLIFVGKNSLSFYVIHIFFLYYLNYTFNLFGNTPEGLFEIGIVFVFILLLFYLIYVLNLKKLLIFEKILRFGDKYIMKSSK